MRGLILSGILLCGAAQAASFEMRLVAPCGPADKTYILVGTTHEVCLAKDAVIDQSGVVRATRYPVINKAVVEITPAATQALHDVTEANTGKELAVLFDGKLIFKAAIMAPLKLEKLPLTLNNAPDAVDALVAAFPGPNP